MQIGKNVHFIGIGGIGMSAVAKLLLAQGKSVSGSDLAVSEITKELENRGIRFFDKQTKDNVSKDIDLVIYSSAVQKDNPERIKATELGIKQLSYPEFLGEFSKQYSTIVVTGTNGKSTTTAMLGLILEAAGYDPTVLVGSLVPGWEMGNLRIGKSRFFVVEGCEYRAHMLHLEPEMIVLTNIEEDHLDYYKDIDHIRETFQKFVDKLSNKGLVVVNADDEQSSKLKISRKVIFGKKNKLGDLKLQVPGEFNLMNAFAATTAAMELGVTFEICQKTLENFKGIWRRFERVGEFNGAIIISDYGHHPTAVRETMKAAKEFYPDKRIVLCFQPHQHSRTLEMKDEFINVLMNVDHLLIPEIYGVVGRTEEEESMISSQDLVDGVKAKDPDHDIQYAPDLDLAEKMLRDMIQKDDVVIIMGAGDVDQIARNLIT